MKKLVARRINLPKIRPIGEDSDPSETQLYGFERDGTALSPMNKGMVGRVADMIAKSWKSGQPIPTVKITGYASSEGSATHNQALGLRRAMAVRKALQDALKERDRSLFFKVLVLASSRGESDQIGAVGDHDVQASNRRVVIKTSTQFLLPAKKEKKIEIPKVHPGDIIASKREVCQREYQQCLKKCSYDKGVILNAVAGVTGLSKCISMGPVGGLVCAALFGWKGKQLIDDYFRVDQCEQRCKSARDTCWDQSAR